MKNKEPDFKIDYDFARWCYRDGRFDECAVPQSFRPAFVMTNENLRRQIPAFGRVSGDILTVAASGDQPIYYALNGARSITTFDETFCARVIMDLKIAMVQKLPYSKYRRMMADLASIRGGIMEIDGVADLLPLMPNKTSDFMRKMSAYNIFGYGWAADDAYFTPYEFIGAKNMKLQPFEFIWSDITNLHTKLHQKYDVINVSNIFDWIDTDMVLPTVQRLFCFLRPGGYILSTMFFRGSVAKPAFESVARQLPKRTRIETDYTMGTEAVIILRRTR